MIWLLVCVIWLCIYLKYDLFSVDIFWLVYVICGVCFFDYMKFVMYVIGKIV